MDVIIKNGITIINMNKEADHHNKYGVKGLWYRKEHDIYILSATYLSKRYYIGKFKTTEEAAKVRKIADEKIEDGSFIEWLKEYKNYCKIMNKIIDKTIEI